MTKQELINAIEFKIGGTKYGIWTIGVTDYTDTRKSQHKGEGKSVTYWEHWPTDSESIGRAVETHFLDLGMKGGEGGGGKASYVYIF